MSNDVSDSERSRAVTPPHPARNRPTSPDRELPDPQNADHTGQRTVRASIERGTQAMWDIYDPRDSEDRDRGGSWDRPRGSRGGRSDRDDEGVYDPRDVFVRDVDLPHEPERELVRDRDRTYELNRSDSRVLATVGAFRVVSESDLDRSFENRADARESLKHLLGEGLLRRSPSGPDDRVAFLSNRGRDLLEASRWERDDRSGRPGQAFYAGLRKPRELGHDSQVYRAYLRAEERLRSAGGRVRRVVLDYELKRDYQRFLQERNRDRPDSDGRPDRTPREIEAWAREHGLPYFDERVHFPDLRIEYDDREGYANREDVEVMTGHYRGAHAAAAGRSGFTRYRAGGGLAGGRGGGRRGGSALPRLAEELL